jgi:hypothetical protein
MLTKKNVYLTAKQMFSRAVVLVRQMSRGVILVVVGLVIGFLLYLWSLRRNRPEPPVFFVHRLPEQVSTEAQASAEQPPETLEARARDAIRRGNGAEAFQLLRMSIENEHSAVAVIMIAELYKNGIHASVNPDKLTACRLYRVILDNREKFPDHVIETAQQNYDDIVTTFASGNRHDTDVVDGCILLPTDFHFDLARILVRFEDLQRLHEPARAHRTEHHLVQPLRQWQYGMLQPAIIQEVPEEDDDDVPQEVILDTIREAARAQVQINDDTQNVHSSTVLSCAVAVLKECQRAPQLSYKECVERLFESCAKFRVDVSKIDRVLRRLTHDTHARFGASDTDAFVAVVSKIQSNPNAQKRDNLMEILARQLESAIERGQVVCSTGRIVRILSVFDGVEDLGTAGSTQKIVPEWALDQEFANLAAQVRDRVLGKASSKDRADYESGASEKLTDMMSDEFQKEARKTYSTILAPEVIERKMNVYTSAF